VICLGRIIYGFSAGVMICATPKMIEETIPENVAEKFGISTNIFINLACCICMMLASGLP